VILPLDNSAPSPLLVLENLIRQPNWGGLPNWVSSAQPHIEDHFLSLQRVDMVKRSNSHGLTELSTYILP
jgi:hypothetical protein